MSDMNVTVACVQMNSGAEMESNLMQAGELIKEAAKEGAEFILTPENTDFMGENRNDTLSRALESHNHPGILFFSQLAKQYGVWLLVGSMKIKQEDGKLANRSFLFRNTGQLAATYDKIHLFDASIPNGETHQESETFNAGDTAVLVSTPWDYVGMSVCYDVRFPYLYREMAKKGARMMSIPAAFTSETGKVHWEVLLRARAIETGSYILAPAQCGSHPGKRKTFGHSMIINPWGKIIQVREEDTPGFIMSKIDLVNVSKARSAIPSLEHDRSYETFIGKGIG